MGEGQNRVARALIDLEPTSIVDLFILYPDVNELPDLKIPFHGGINVDKALVWQGLTYLPIGIELDSFEKNSDGTVNRPKIKFSNNEYYLTYLLKKYKDFANAKIIRKRTLVEFLDDENFDGGNPFGVPDSRAEIASEEYVISQKTQETKDYVEFELTSPLDLDNKFITNRKIYGKYCFWDYRGEGCEYKGIPVQKQDGTRFTASDGTSPLNIKSDKSFSYADNFNLYTKDKTYFPGDVVFTANNRIKIYDPKGIEKPRPLLTYYVAREKVNGKDPSSHPQFWDRDGCNKKLSSCFLRFNPFKRIKRFLGEATQERYTFKTERSGSQFRMIPRTVSSGNTIVEDGTEENSTQELADLMNLNYWTVIINFIAFPSDEDSASEIFSTIPIGEEGEGMFRVYRRRSRFYFELNFNGGPDTFLLPSFSAQKNGETYRNNPLVISRSGGDFEIRMPELDFKRRIVLSSGRRNNLKQAKDFRFFYDPVKDKSMISNCDSILVFKNYKNDSFYDGFWLDDLKDGGLRAPVYNPNIYDQWWVMAWWELSERSTDLRVPNRAANDISDLFFYSPGSSEFKTWKDEHSYNQFKRVNTQNEIKTLPFGGFPGTDGFDFKQE